MNLFSLGFFSDHFSADRREKSASAEGGSLLSIDFLRLSFFFSLTDDSTSTDRLCMRAALVLPFFEDFLLFFFLFFDGLFFLGLSLDDEDDEPDDEEEELSELDEVDSDDELSEE